MAITPNPIVRPAAPAPAPAAVPAPKAAAPEPEKVEVAANTVLNPKTDTAVGGISAATLEEMEAGKKALARQVVSASKE